MNDRIKINNIYKYLRRLPVLTIYISHKRQTYINDTLNNKNNNFIIDIALFQYNIIYMNLISWFCLEEQ